MFSPSQIEMLSAPLSRANVKERGEGNRTFSYIEGWVTIAEANRIFGFDKWSRETVEARCVSEKARKIGVKEGFAGYDGWGVTYICRVRLTVDGIVREGCGSGHGIDRDLGLAHESALKEAETDAMKRGFMTFGNPFGLALYDKKQENVADEADISRLRFIDECKASIRRIGDHPDKNDVLRWWNSEPQKKARRDFGLRPHEVDDLKTLVLAASNKEQ